MFAGIGGFRSGLSHYGDFFVPVGYCEIDPYAKRAYEAIYEPKGEIYDGYDPLDIQAFAKDYLKLDISYFAFDPDTGIEGMRTGNQIILDDRLLDDKKAGERNFTIAHECGHDLINWQDPSYSPQTVVNYRIKSSRKSLVTEDDFKEWQANVVIRGKADGETPIHLSGGE